MGAVESGRLCVKVADVWAQADDVKSDKLIGSKKGTLTVTRTNFTVFYVFIELACSVTCFELPGIFWWQFVIFEILFLKFLSSLNLVLGHIPGKPGLRVRRGTEASEMWIIPE